MIEENEKGKIVYSYIEKLMTNNVEINRELNIVVGTTPSIKIWPSVFTKYKLNDINYN